MRAVFVLAAGLAFLVGPVFAAESDNAGETGKAENCDGGTYQLMECMEAQRVYWDKKLTAAYQSALKDSEPAQRNLLREAERAWITYRDANCDYYGAAEGSIARVNAVWCLRDMTEKRARELAEPPYTN